MTMGRPRSGNDYVPVKFSRRLAGMARLVALAKGVTQAEYLSEAARPAIERDFLAHMRSLESKNAETRP